MSHPDASQGSLVDRGGGLLYDEVLDLTWLQDASWAQTSGYKANGKMNWKDANAWARSLVYRDEVRGVDLTGWRLPRVRPRSGQAWNGRFCLDGSSDEGYNFSTPHSELAWMFYMNLGLCGYYSPAGEEQPHSGAGGNGKMGYVVNVGLVKNLVSHIYWTSTPAEPYLDRNGWMFDFIFGFQNFYNQNDMLCAWAVRDGDVADLVPRKGGTRRAPKPHRQIKPARVPIEILEEPSHQELDTYTETLAGVRCDLPFDDGIQADRYALMKTGMEKVLSLPSLAGFWTFGEKPGLSRQSIIAGAPFPLGEIAGPVPRLPGGPYSSFCAELTGERILEWTAANGAGAGLLAGAPSCSLFAVVRQERAGRLLAFSWEGGRSFALETDALGLPTGAWATVGLTHDGARVTWHLNGKVSQSKIEAALPATDASRLTLGEASSTGWKGRVGGLAIFHRALGPHEMERLHACAHLDLVD